MKDKLSIHDIIQTKPLTKLESNLIERKMAALLASDSGNSQPFRLAVGDKVENFGAYKEGFAMPCGTVIEVYRENGHNRAATEKGFFREQDLRKI